MPIGWLKKLFGAFSSPSRMVYAEDQAVAVRILVH